MPNSDSKAGNKQIVLIGVLVVVYIVLFAIIAIVGDLEATLAINQWQVQSPAWFRDLSKFYTKYGYYIFGLTALAIGIAAFYVDKLERLRPYRVMFLGLIFGFLASWVLTGYILKPIIQRARPYWEYPTSFDTHGVVGTNFSMPSGHATAAFGMSGALMVRVKNWPARAFFAAYAISMALTRPFFGVHYVSDILVGSIIGLGCSVGFYVLFESLVKKGKLSDAAQKKVFLIGVVGVIISIVLDLTA